MFVSRTVAAEVCMEARVNDGGYTALKQLDKSGHLRFELGYVGFVSRAYPGIAKILLTETSLRIY